jgi:hypothetical protein
MKTRFTHLMVLVFLITISSQGFGNQLRNSRFSERPETKQTDTELQLKKLQNSKHGADRLSRILSVKSQTNSEMWELESIVSSDYWKTEFHYNESGQNTEIIELYWDGNEWMNEWREVWSWSNDQVILIEEYLWDDEAGQWMLGWKTEFAYEGNTMTMKFYYLEGGNSWVLTYKEVVELDEHQNIVLYTSYFWNDFDQEWFPIWLEEYTYDELNRLILFIEYYFYDFVREWFPEWKEETTYTGNTAETLGYYWDGEEWFLDEMIEFLLDDYGDIVEEIYYYWDEDEEEWMVGEKMVYIYDYTYTIENLVVPTWYEFKHMITHATLFYWTGDMWVEDFSVELNWKDISTGLVSLSDPLVRLYPNPATDYFNIRMNNAASSYTFELYDLCGSLLSSTQLTGDAKLPAIGLAPGMYMYRILLDGNRMSGKILVK